MLTNLAEGTAPVLRQRHTCRYPPRPPGTAAHLPRLASGRRADLAPSSPLLDLALSLQSFSCLSNPLKPAQNLAAAEPEAAEPSTLERVWCVCLPHPSSQSRLSPPSVSLSSLALLSYSLRALSLSLSLPSNPPKQAQSSPVQSSPIPSIPCHPRTSAAARPSANENKLLPGSRSESAPICFSLLLVPSSSGPVWCHFCIFSPPSPLLFPQGLSLSPSPHLLPAATAGSPQKTGPKSQAPAQHREGIPEVRLRRLGLVTPKAFPQLNRQPRRIIILLLASPSRANLNPSLELSPARPPQRLPTG
ncbi:hypothetical protein CCMA1212_004849 [Trichoderma ghanense]|uniref:Uncharacterized protein n=1 Tax=Trichoderma ghanense TaxID=65468 RepID=A0ABY2H4J7_9HYPO